MSIMEEEFKLIIKGLVDEVNRFKSENLRLESICKDRLLEIEDKSYQNSKLLIRVALAYAEIDRLSSRQVEAAV